MSGYLTVGDNKSYSSHGLAITALKTIISGDWTGKGIWKINTYAKAEQYSESINTLTGFIGADANNHLIMESQINHFGLKSQGNIFKMYEEGSYIFGPFTKFVGYVIAGQTSEWSRTNSRLCYLYEGVQFRRNIIADIISPRGAFTWHMLDYWGPDCIIRNNFIQNCKVTGTNARAIGIDVATSWYIDNNTVYNVQYPFYSVSGKAPASLCNNVASSFVGVYDAGFASNNASVNATAPGVNPLYNIIAANEFVNVADPETYDLHLKEGAQCIGAGLDLSAQFKDEIDNGIRKLPWDRSADGYGIVPIKSKNIEQFIGNTDLINRVNMINHIGICSLK